MIKWFEDDEVLIEFNKAPNVKVRVIPPYLTKQEIKEIKKKPFVCCEDLQVKIEDKVNKVIYEFVIPQGYCWNGSDIPRVFWRIIGSRYEPQYLIASCLHDYTLEHKHLIKTDRRLTSKVFRACLLETGVGRFKANLMCEAVDLFQRFCKW